MVSSPELAKQISDLMLNTFYKIDESLAAVKNSSPPAEAAAYRKAVANVLGAIVMDVLEPLYEDHPALKPHNWDEDKQDARSG